MTKWLPPIGSTIPVGLPQEIIRGVVTAYVNDDTLDAILNVQPPMSKSHSYRFKQTVRLTRRKAEPTGDKWAVEEVEE